MLTNFDPDLDWHYKSCWIQIRIEKNSWIRIRKKMNADPQSWWRVYRLHNWMCDKLLSLLPTYFFQCARAWCSLRAILQVGQFFRDSLSNVIKKYQFKQPTGQKNCSASPSLPPGLVWQPGSQTSSKARCIFNAYLSYFSEETR